MVGFAPQGVFGSHDWREGAAGIQWVGPKDAAKQPTMHETAPRGKDLGGPEPQLCCRLDTLLSGFLSCS